MIEDKVEEFITALNEREADLLQEAKALASVLMAERKKRAHLKDPEERGGRLLLRVRGRGEKGSAGFQVEWILSHRFRNKDKSGYTNRYRSIPKGRTNKYSASKLLMKARDWERDLILSLEDQAAPIREEVKKIADLRKRARMYHKYLMEE